MKRIFLLILFLTFLLTKSQAQTNYVEVVVVDTVLVAADQFVFQVMAMPDMYAEADTAPPSRVNYMVREREMRQKQKQQLDALEVKLRSGGFLPLPSGIQDMMAGRGFGNFFLSYRISSPDALKRFQEILRQEPSINAVLQSATSSREETEQKRLYSKLMEKARQRADYLAGISGKKITGMLLISENIPEGREWRYMTTTTTRVVEEAGINTSYPLPGKLMVRYSWN